MNDASNVPWVGRSLKRREDRRLLTGRGHFVADLVLPRMLHAVLVRSPLAHARIRAVDLSRAKAAPGADLLQLLPPVPEGVGKGGAVAPPAAIANAVCDAFGGFCLEINATPVRPAEIARLYADMAGGLRPPAA